MSHPDLSILQREIVSDDDANAAFALLSWIAAQRKSLESHCDLEIAQARRRLAESSRLAIDGESFPFDDIVKSIEQSLCKFASAQRPRLFATRKTARFDLGEIRIRKRSASVSFAEGETAATVLPRVEDPRYKRTKEELDTTSIKSDREKSLLTDEQLAAWGLVYVPGQDDTSVHVDG